MSKLTYLATVYRKHPGGHEQAYIDACKAAAYCIGLGMDVFCPIAHGHGLSEHGGVPPDDHKLWMRLNRPFLIRCDKLLVAKMPGWDESEGIADEIATFQRHHKPVSYLKWPL